MFRNALSHVQRNPKALLIYAGISASFFGVLVLFEYMLIGIIKVDTITQNQTVYVIATGTLTGVIIAIAQSLSFTLLGTDIDRPFWKPKAGGGAFLKTCSFWFTLNYINIAAVLFIGLSSFEDDTKQSLLLFQSLYEVLYIPFGATVMFYANSARYELGKALHTMLLQLPLFLLAGFFGLFFLSLLQTLQASLPPYSLPILAIIDAYFACFIFAYTWEICKRNREQEENADDDLDF